MIAHQYLIREEKSRIEKLDFDISKVSLKNTDIRVIDKQTASNLIIEYEWLKTMPYIVKYCFGIYFKIDDKEYLGGVVTFGEDYAENTGVWQNYNFGDKLILLNRGVCLWWTPKNTASYFISKTVDWFKKNTRFRIFTATVDPNAGEIGTIYQALNWHYVGLMSGNYNNSKESKRFSVLIDGKLRYSRWVRKQLGTMKKEEILKHYPNAVFIPQYRKRRYFYFFDTKKENELYYNSIKHLLMPYPKRVDGEINGLIYLITNTINNKKYIGQTIRSFKDRINDYKRGMCNDYIKNSFNKYGFETFKFEIIDTAKSLEELNEKEIYYINKYDTTNKEVGYNIELGGKNCIASEETRAKMSIAHSKIKQTEEWVRKRIPQAGSLEAKKHGRPKTDEDKKYLSEISPKYWLGKERSEESKRKMSEVKKAKGFSDKQKEANCKTVYVFDVNTRELLDTFESTGLASAKYNIHQSSISRYCKNNKIVNNQLWTYNNYYVENIKRQHYYIIKIVNTLNNKVFIIKTSKNIINDVNSYEKYINRSNDTKYFYNDIDVLGLDFFTFEVIETLDNEIDLNEKILFYINKLNTTNIDFGYNVTYVKPKEYKIRKNVLQNEEWVQKRLDAVSKKVLKVDIKTNQIVETFPSLANAGEFNKDGLNYSCIGNRCNGISKQNGDYIWCYEEDFLNNTIPSFISKEVREFNSLSEDEINEIVSKHNNDKLSSKEIARQHNINPSTLLKFLNDLTKPKSIFAENVKYDAICKKTNKVFSDYLNESGALTSHITEHYPDVIIESRFKRKSIELKTGKPWYYEYFDFKVNDEVIQLKKCQYCDWTTSDIENKSGAFEKHLSTVHDVDIFEHLRNYPEDSTYIKKSELIDYVTCKICGKKFKAINSKHLNEHNISVSEYKEKYGHEIINNELKEKYSHNFDDYNNKHYKTLVA
jgi:group I intron endonuclease